jgi:hypothetical protein
LHHEEQLLTNATDHTSIASLLAKAQKAYALVTGLENRIRWRKEIAALELQLQEETERTINHV